MEQIALGRTGFRVSRMGLGGGGHSRLGRSTGREEGESVAVVRRALEMGINFIDTAEGYGTEEIVGRGIRGHERGSVVLSTKKSMSVERPVTALQLREGLEQSLRRLGTDYVDVYHLHGLTAGQYDHAVGVLVPELIKLKEQGKIRATGVTEAFHSDSGHLMLQRAMEDDCWDVIMVGFNILNQSARERVLAAAMRKKVGTLCMFAVRVAFSRPEQLRKTVGELMAQGKLDRALVDAEDPLGFVREDGAAMNTVDAAYRFCRDEPGMQVILSGTGDVGHLEENAASMLRPPLPAQVRDRLVRMFAGIDSVSGQ